MTVSNPGAGAASALGARRPHRYNPDRNTPGTCRCRLIKANFVHDEKAIAALAEEVHAQQSEHLRRLGERED